MTPHLNDLLDRERSESEVLDFEKEKKRDCGWDIYRGDDNWG